MESVNTKKKNCPKGTQRNRKTGNCDPVKSNKNTKQEQSLLKNINPIVNDIANFGLDPILNIKPVIPKPASLSSSVNPVQPSVEESNQLTETPPPLPPVNTTNLPLDLDKVNNIDVKKKCPNGTRKNPKTGNCEPKNTTMKLPKINALTGRKRCPNGTRKNPKTGNCDPKNEVLKHPSIDPLTGRKRCPNGTHKNPKTGNCKSKNTTVKLSKIVPLTGHKRCPNGYRKNRKTGECESTTVKQEKKKVIVVKNAPVDSNLTNKNLSVPAHETLSLPSFSPNESIKPLSVKPVSASPDDKTLSVPADETLSLPSLSPNESIKPLSYKPVSASPDVNPADEILGVSNNTISPSPTDKTVDSSSPNDTITSLNNKTLGSSPDITPITNENITSHGLSSNNNITPFVDETLKEPDDSIKEPALENEEDTLITKSPEKNEGDVSSPKEETTAFAPPPLLPFAPSSLKPEDYSKELDNQQFDQNSNDSKNFKEKFEYKMNEKPTTDEFPFLYPDLNDPNFNTKIAKRKEFNDFRYDGNIYDIKKQSNALCHAEFELFPHQIFVKNFLSLQTPYNSLLLYHGLGTGKTCSAIGIAEENRKYMKQVGLNRHKIIIIASPNVQDNFRLQLFNERKLKQVNGIWNIRSCIGNTFINEINPSQLTGMPREKVISSINSIISTYYDFMGYIEFSNYASKKINAIPPIVVKEKERERYRIKNIKKTFNNRFIIVDEVHNIRLVDDNKNKSTAKFLFQIAEHSDNLRLLLLSATPMYNSYREIIWLINLLNINDKRSQIKITDVFDKHGNFKKVTNPTDSENQWKEDGKSLLIRKLTGYVSYVRSENPYSFPFRIYKKQTDIEVTPPKYQINDSLIETPLQHISIYYTNVGETQEKGYNMIVDFLKNYRYTDENGGDDLIESSETGTITGGAPTDPAPATKNPNSNINETDNKRGYNGFTSLFGSFNPDNDNNKNKPDTGSIPVLNETESSTDSPAPPSSVIIQKNNPPLNYTTVVSQAVRGDPTTPDNTPPDETIEAFGYNKLQFPIQSLNIIYPNKILETEGIQSIDQISLIVGKKGLDEIMEYQDNTAENVQPEKFNYNYKPGVLAKYGRIFHRDNIKKYSGKISRICDIIRKSSKGIIMIYSQYIDGGIVPICLALEEMGITRYGSASYTKSLFQTPPTEPVDSGTMKTRADLKMTDATAVFSPAKYIIISGDIAFSPTNDEDIKYITSEENKYGELVKVVIISKAGAEGLDFRNIRQIHVMEPWYNMNRIEQIIGRGVRNLSHCSLPFEERNVEIFLHSSILPSSQEKECADTYVYRTAEKKAIQIGRVTRIIKETAVDCMLNIGQTNFSIERFTALVENQNVKINISSEGGAEIDHVIGDKPYTDMCDYMDNCEYKCHIPVNGEKAVDFDDPAFEADKSTFGLEFISDNNSRIIERIRGLFRERPFYTRKNLIQALNSQRPYPLEQIYSSLTYLIQNKNEYLIDTYGRLGNLVNKGDIYTFQPIEITDENISIYERNAPVEYRRSELNVQVPAEFKEPGDDDSVLIPRPPAVSQFAPLAPPSQSAAAAEFAPLAPPSPPAPFSSIAPVAPGPTPPKKKEKVIQIIDDIERSYSTLVSLTIDDIESIPEKGQTTAMNIRIVRDHIVTTFGITAGQIVKYSIYKLLDSLNLKEKLLLLDEMYGGGKAVPITETAPQLSPIYTELNRLIYQYFKERRLANEKHVFALTDEQQNLAIYSYTVQEGWVQQYNTKPFLDELKRFVVPINRISDIFGFIEKGVFKIRDKNNKRNKGFDIIQSGKQRSIEILNYFVELFNRQRSVFGMEEPVEGYTPENTINIKQRGICAIVEILVRFIKEKNAGSATVPVVFLTEEEMSIIKKHI